jgi:hypothetical protein
MEGIMDMNDFKWYLMLFKDTLTRMEKEGRLTPADHLIIQEHIYNLLNVIDY